MQMHMVRFLCSTLRYRAVLKVTWLSVTSRLESTVADSVIAGEPNLPCVGSQILVGAADRDLGTTLNPQQYSRRWHREVFEKTKA